MWLCEEDFSIIYYFYWFTCELTKIPHLSVLSKTDNDDVQCYRGNICIGIKDYIMTVVAFILLSQETETES